ncbi:MAG: dynamin family protein [Lautropia sp.]|nr:dynamin family protein [Lautropia sp.]
MAKKGISEQIEAYGRWRSDLQSAIERYRNWLAQSDAADSSLNLKLVQIVERLHDTLLKVAFVAEFSRGKSELINAIFFAQYGQRVVPSSAGRTTMCPTELLYDPATPVGIRLLPIETRLLPVPLADLRQQDEHWRFIPVDMTDVMSLRQAFDSVRETRLVTTEQARELGLYDEAQPVGRSVSPGQVEIPAWRHAIVNIPHPLLELGLVIIDTPGLNAIGAEPELTLNLIPNAHAVLFVLAADAGVTRSDIDVWQAHISKAHRTGRFVVLNKIDGLWDELRPEAENDLEIARQVVSVSNFLDLPTARVYPVSAQKGLVAKIQGDQALLRRSRLKELEHALSEEMIPQQQVIISEQVRREFEEASAVTLNLLTVRRRNQVEQAFELNGLRGKNQAMIRQMSKRVRDERSEFDGSLRHLAALRSVFTKHSQTMFTHMSQDSLRRHVDRTRQMMLASQLSTQLRDGMNALLTAVRLDFEEADRLVAEISQMMSAMYQRFSRDYGLSLGTPLRFSTKRYFTEIEQVAQTHQRQFGLLKLLTVNKVVLTQRFFDSAVVSLKKIYSVAIRELESWLRSLMTPLESQVREHQAQLRRRMESVQRVMDAGDSLEERLQEIEQARARIEEQLTRLKALVADVQAAIDRRPVRVAGDDGALERPVVPEPNTELAMGEGGAAI